MCYNYEKFGKSFLDYTKRDNFMNLHSYMAYLLVAFLTITSPGAAILLAISNGMRYSLKAVAVSTIANALGLFVLSSVAMLGVGALLKTSALFFVILKFTGAFYLIYLGVKLFLKKELAIHIKQEAHLQNVNYVKIFKTGFLVAVTNPKPILFFTAIFPLFMSAKYSLMGQFFIMTFTFLIISMSSLMFYGYMSSRFKAWFSDVKSLHIFNKITGALFVGMGSALAFYSKKVA